MDRKVLSVILLGGFLLILSSCTGIQQKKDKEKTRANVYYQLGLSYLANGDYQKALIEFRKMETLQPKDPELRNAMGLVYYYTGRFEKAEREYRKAISLKGDFSEAYVNLGTLLAKQEKCMEAIDEYQKALENPFYATPATALHNIGLCHLQMGNLEEAESSLIEAVRQDRKLIRAYLDLGKLHYETNRMEQAIQVFSQAIQQQPRVEEDPAGDLNLALLHYWLALSYFKNSDAANAVIHFREVTALAADTTLSEEAWKYLNLLQ